MARNLGRYSTDAFICNMGVWLQDAVALWLDGPAGRAMVDPHWVQKSEWTPRTEAGSIP